MAELNIDALQRQLDALERSIGGMAHSLAQKQSRRDQLESQLNDAVEKARERWERVAASMAAGTLASANPAATEQRARADYETARKTRDARLAGPDLGIEQLGNRMAAQVARANEVRGRIATAPPGMAAPAGEAAGAGGAAGGIAAGMADVAGAAGLAAAAFTAAAGSVAGFVQAFSPATLLQFNLAMKDAAAVVGSALAPVLEIMTQAVREVSAMLYPVAQALAPVFQQLAETLKAVFMPIIDQVAANIQFLLPAIRFLGDLFSNLATVVRVNWAILAGFAQVLENFVASFMPTGDTLKSFSDQVRDAFGELAKAALLTAAYLARLVGATGFIDGMLKSLTGGRAERRDATGLGAPSQARLSGVPEFAASVMTAAFTATGAGAGPKKTEDWLADAVKGIEEIKAGNDQSIDKLIEAIGRITDQAVKSILEGLSKGAQGALAEKALDVSRHPVAFALTPGTGVVPYLLAMLTGKR
jgi:hypothetical protein